MDPEQEVITPEQLRDLAEDYKEVDEIAFIMLHVLAQLHERPMIVTTNRGLVTCGNCLRSLGEGGKQG